MSSRHLSLAAVMVALSACAEASQPVERSDDALNLTAPGGCFARHVHEAIALNRERLPVYAELSEGRSRIVSSTLIASEVATLAIGATYDARAFLLQRAGIPIMCDEFVSMDEAPELDGPVDPGEDAPALVSSLDVAKLRDAAKAAYQRGGFPALSKHLEAVLEELAPHPSYLCMTRHFVESALRASNLAPRHREAARDARVGFLKPENISKDFIYLQLDALPLAIGLDRMAAPMQEEGIPILCADLPPIPAW